MPKLAANGIEISHWIRGDGEPLLLIPGAGADHVIWNLQVAELRREYRCIVFDPRGTGGTGKGSVSPYTTRLLAEDAAALLLALGVNKAHVAGQSLGAAVAQELALAYPGLVHTLSLHSPWERTASYPHLRRQLEMRRHLLEIGDWPLVVAASSLALFSARFINEHEPQIQEWERLRLKDPPALDSLIEHYNAALGHNAAERLPFIGCPTLITAGSRDVVCLPEYSQAVHKLISGSELVVLEGVGHLSSFEAPAQFNRVQLEFLRRHPI
ncbi:MAG: alpha/beta fold hydrolase [Chloroflexi bacterium]|nr:alpha/beta fold hydrolase [Chloroflexota bacterium]